jgi:hypothetical protein
VLSIVSVADVSASVCVIEIVPRSFAGRNEPTTWPVHSPPLVDCSVIGPLQTPARFGMNSDGADGETGRC